MHKDGSGDQGTSIGVDCSRQVALPDWRWALAGNSAGNPWSLDHSCRDTMQGSDNLQWPAPTGEDLPCTADVIAADPLLEALADNGGPTATMALPAGSPAIDAGDSCPATDQRGLPRSGACDLGAFELQ